MIYCDLSKQEKRELTMWDKFRTVLRRVKAKLLTATIVVATSVVIVCQRIPRGYCAESTADTITDWMPTIISFAMLAVVLGFVKKVGS